MPMLTRRLLSDSSFSMGGLLHNATGDASTKCCSLPDDVFVESLQTVAMSKREKQPQRPLHYLQQWREFKKMTQAQLADRVVPQTTPGVISLIEGYNRKLSDKWARRLGLALGIK